MPKTAAEIIEDKGGSATFAAAIAYEAGAVRMMKHRNRLPRTVWPDILKAFPDLTMDHLLAAERAAEKAG